MASMRVLALSDIHVDYSENAAWIEALSDVDYQRDVLLLAGDVSHRMDRIEYALKTLRKKFAEVFFLNGNHELWLLGSESPDSLHKFQRIVELCRQVGVRTEPLKVDDGACGLWIVPLLGWYDKPDHGSSSLFLPRPPSPSDGLDAWADERHVRWPHVGGPAKFFHQANRSHVSRAYDAPVISFSHFLPRADLMFPRLPPGVKPDRWPIPDGFNFSQVAGSWVLDEQIRRIGSAVHVYGHQHRNRWTEIGGVHYVSHCLGYPHERASGRLGYLGAGPCVVWQNGAPGES